MIPLPDYIPISNIPNLARHTGSMGVVNTDKQARTRYIIQRDKILMEKNLLHKAIEEISFLKNDLNELRKIVLTYIN
jgi:hypothetical protein